MSEREEKARLVIPVGEGDHAQGPPCAPVTLVEYGDYECPGCHRARAVVKEVQRQFGVWLRFVFRHFPQPERHARAVAAAEAAEAAGAQERFWEMSDRLLKSEGKLCDQTLLCQAEELRLDVDRFAAALLRRTYAAAVREDLAGGLASGVRRTPAFFINGVRYRGRHEFDEIMEAVIEVGGEELETFDFQVNS